MTVEELIHTALSPLVSSRVIADLALEGTPLPYITYQQVGGEAINFIDPTNPNKSNGRFQISVWATNRTECARIARQAEAELRQAPLQTTVLGAMTAIYEPQTKIHGSQQDFSFWFST